MWPMRLFPTRLGNHPSQQALRTFMRPTVRAFTDFHNTQDFGHFLPHPFLARTPTLNKVRTGMPGLLCLRRITPTPRP